MDAYNCMPDDGLVTRGLLRPNATRLINFFKSTNLIKFAFSVLLPKVFRADASIEMREQMRFYDPRTVIAYVFQAKDAGIMESMVKSNFTHDAASVIPAVIGILTRHELRTFNTVCPFSGLILHFPVDLTDPRIAVFIIGVTGFVLKHHDILDLDELFEVTKLLEYYECKLGNNLITKVQREKLLRRILSMSEFPNYAGKVGAIMRFQWTIFNDLDKAMFIPLKDRFNSYCEKRECDANIASANHAAEIILSNALKDVLITELLKCLKCNYICPHTGKEIDIAFVSRNVKLAFHIDGKPWHYHLDRDQINCDTLVRNTALKNAGWVNYYIPLTKVETPSPEEASVFAKEAFKRIYKSTTSFETLTEFDDTIFIDQSCPSSTAKARLVA